VIGDTAKSTARHQADSTVGWHVWGWQEALDPVMAVVTVGRLALIPLVLLWLSTAPLLSGLALLIFIVADIYDGVIGRRRGTDGASRRALDSIVDRLAIDTVLVAMAVRGYLPAEMLALILARDAYCAHQCSRLSARWVAVRADWMYKTLNLSLAAWVLVAGQLTADARVAFIGVIFAYSLIVAVDLTRAVQGVLALPENIRRTVISAGILRAARRASSEPTPLAQDPSTSLTIA
jgi:phosphatidylglycerophosphate synthase